MTSPDRPFSAATDAAGTAPAAGDAAVEHLEGLFNELSDGVVRLDADRRLEFANPAFGELLVHDVSEILGRPLDDFVVADDHTPLQELLDTPCGTPRALTFETSDRRSVALLCSHHRPGHSVAASCHLVLKSTEFHAASVEQRLRRQFASLVHHELKTPLTSILGASRLLQAEAKDRRGSEPSHLLDILVRNCRRLAWLIGGLLDLQRLHLGTLSYDLEDVELRPLLEPLALLPDPGPDGRRQPVTVLQLGPSCDVTGLSVRADRNKLRRVFEDLLAEDSRLFGAEPALRVDIELEADTVHIRLSHPEPSSSQRAETHAGRRDDDTPRPDQGVGIGLALAKGLVRGMGGTLTVVRAPHRGSSIVLHLPRSRS